MLEPELSEQDYLRKFELPAADVVDAAREEGWQTFENDSVTATRLQRAVNELAHTLRHQHFEGDGCVEEDRSILHLGGAALITPGVPTRW